MNLDTDRFIGLTCLGISANVLLSIGIGLALSSGATACILGGVLLLVQGAASMYVFMKEK